MYRLRNETLDPFPPTNAVFHARRVFDAERELIFGDSWLFDEGPGPTRRAERVGRLGFCHRGTSDGSLEDFLGPILGEVQAVSDAAVTPLFETRMEIAGNWKLVVSGAIEDYHLPTVHKQTVTPWRTSPAKPFLASGGHSSYVTPAKVGAIPKALHRLIVGSAPVEEIFKNTLVFPNLLLIRLWGLTHVTTFEPLSPGRTLRVTRVFDCSAGRSLADPRRWSRATVARAFKLGANVTFREDRAIVEEAHAGTLAGRRLLRGPAHVEEARVEHFLAEVGRRLRGSPAALGQPEEGGQQEQVSDEGEDNSQ